MNALVRKRYPSDAVFARLMKAMRQNELRILACAVGVTNDRWFAATSRRRQLEQMLHDLTIEEHYANPTGQGLRSNTLDPVVGGPND